MAHTHRTRFGNAARFSGFQNSTNLLFGKFYGNFFITFQLLDSSTKVFYCRPIYLLSKNEKSRRVDTSRPVRVGLDGTKKINIRLGLERAKNGCLRSAEEAS